MNTGEVCNFIRFGGCPIQCRFCDTDYNTKQLLTAGEIMNKLSPRTPIVLTGGEPTMHHDLGPLLESLRGYHLYGELRLETAGYRDPSWLHYVDFVSLSPKKGHAVALDRADEVKWLWPEWTISEYNWNLSQYHFLQPINGKKDIDEELQTAAVKRLIEFEDVPHGKTLRLGYQLHKQLRIK